MKVKIVYGEDIRRWRCPELQRLRALVMFVCRTFEDLNSPADFSVQFQDDEGDRITLCNEGDFVDALNVAMVEKRKSLKVFIIKKEGQQKNVVPLVEEPVVAEKVQPLSPCQILRKKLLVFFTDDKLKNLLPTFVFFFMENYREQGRVAKESLEQMLTIPIFEPIANHELFKNYLQQQIVDWTPRLDAMKPMILSLSDEQIVDLIPQFVGWLEGNQSQVFNNQFFGCCHKQEQGVVVVAAAAAAQDAKEEEEEEEEEANDGVVVHKGVQCDGCQMFPIRGKRFKCGVCRDFDLCEECEAKGVGHDASHPMMKFNVSAWTRFDAPWVGIHEMMRYRFASKKCGNGRRKWRGARRRRYGGRNNHHHHHHHHQMDKREKFSKKREQLLKKLDKINEKLSSQPVMEESGMSCFCGDMLCKTLASEAYGKHVPVFCDGCDRKCDAEKEQVYHCRSGYNNVHKQGYDLCMGCGILQISVASASASVSPSPMTNTEQEQQQEEEKEVLIALREEERVPEPEPEREQEPTMSCFCGDILSKTLASQAYGEHVPVHCDGCDRKCGAAEEVFHCRSGYNNVHRQGYDLCLACGTLQISVPKNDDTPAQEQEETMKKVELDMDMDMDMEIDMEDVIMIDEDDVMVQKAIAEAQAQPAPVVQEPEPEPEHDDFPYPEQFEIVQGMGFQMEKPVVRFLLIKNKGDVQKVVEEIMDM